MKLYDYPPAPNPRRLNLYLAERGIDIPRESIDLMKGEQFSDAYRKINPLLTVPCLQLDDGTSLTQVVAIIDYLEETCDGKPMLGTTPLEKAQIREWSHRVFNEGLMAVAEVLRNSGEGFKDRALPGPLDLEQIPALAERGRKRLVPFLRALDAHLDGRDYMVGDSYTFADVEVQVLCDFAGWIEQSIPEDCPNLQRWYDAVSARANA